MTPQVVTDIVTDVIADLETDPRWPSLTLMDRVVTKMQAQALVRRLLSDVHALIPAPVTGTPPTGSRHVRRTSG
jgi:hypothetical protein